MKRKLKMTNNTKQISSNGVISADIDIDLLEKRGVY